MTTLRSTLATEDQRDAERFALKLLDDGELKAQLASAIAEAISDEPSFTTGEGLARITADVRMWATSLILREFAGDPEAPKVIWVGDTAMRSWFGHVLWGAALAGDNPDTIYRHSFVDGSEVYELTGRFPERPPAEFSIEPLPGLAGVIPSSGTLTGKIGSATGPDLLTDRAIKRGPNGTFRIIFGGATPGDGVQHVPMPEGPVALNFRDVLADWRQQPVALRLSKLSPARSPPLSEAHIRSSVIEHLPAYVRHWRTFKDKWLGGFEPNSFKGPLGREGGWSWILAGRYSLRPGEVAILTARAGEAGYHGCQVTDHWEASFDSAKHHSSLNPSQTAPSPDGWVRYVIAASDPGVANWLDTGGVADGLFLMRWQLFKPGFDARLHVKGYAVAPLEECYRGGFASVTAAERNAALLLRRQEYATRCACPA